MGFMLETYYLLLWILIDADATFITEYKTTWNTAIDNCTMKTPTIMFEGKEADLPVKYDLADNVDVWVGYYLAAASFLYIGCLHVESMSVKAEFDHNTPGLCYSACMKKGLVGISQKKCFCLNDASQSDIFNKECDKGCEDQNNIACGGAKYMSIYRIESAAELYGRNKGCLLFQTNIEGPNSKWSECGTTNGVMCTLNNGSVQNALNNEGNIHYKSWRESMQICFDLKRVPASIDAMGGIKISTPSWTGLITSDVIFSNDAAVTSNVYKRFGYLHKKKNGETVLKFGDNYKEKRILCTNGTLTNKTIEDTNGSDVGVAVGMSVMVVLVIVAIVIGIFVLNRRGHLPGICYNIATPKRKLQTQNVSVVPNTAYEAPSDYPYNEIDETVLQRSIDTPDNFDKDNGNYAHTYFILEGQESDPKKENDIAMSRPEETGNEYNTLRFNLKQGNNTNHAYDTTEKAVKRPKDEHDKSIDGIRGNLFDDMEEDDYNHISGEALKNKRTDNVYGIQTADENEYGGVSTSNENDFQGEGDTYSHIHA
ncbi:uncharacterized protein LOC132742135 [Ruditapes philippinarum]|uniref:uncharacterized protein LOC132742135 n=1 Tax=Ruditapes philippinarum TaxID=129788 RepID=UPI00295B75EE|nr:uncharacterized protein LOC132742135 [Ruditapes philippinarum]